MNAYKTSASPDAMIAMIQGELSSRRRWFYRGVLIAATIMTAGILSLWMTEPRPLPIRLHVAFGVLSCIGVAWIGVLTWILTRKNCPTAVDRLVTGWVALIACVLFLVTAVPIAVARGDNFAALWLSLLGLAMIAVAAYLLRKAYALRAKLQARLATLKAKIRT